MKSVIRVVTLVGAAVLNAQCLLNIRDSSGNYHYHYIIIIITTTKADKGKTPLILTHDEHKKYKIAYKKTSL
jgi:hypothetical protein